MYISWASPVGHGVLVRQLETYQAVAAWVLGAGFVALGVCGVALKGRTLGKGAVDTIMETVAKASNSVVSSASQLGTGLDLAMASAELSQLGSEARSLSTGCMAAVVSPNTLLLAVHVR